MTTTMVTLTTIVVGREDREECFSPNNIARVEPFSAGTDPSPSWRGARITLADNDDTELNVGESVYEVRRRIDAARAAIEAPSAEVAKRRIATVIVERLPWQAIGWAVVMWGLLQGARAASIVQDIYIFAVRTAPPVPVSTQGMF
jgi:hypothetical protein